jgi:VCBS repeat-containing protein
MFDNTPAAIIGEVQMLSGRVVAVAADGSERQLVVGDPIYAGETIRTLGQSTIVVAMNDGTRFDLGRDGVAVMDEAVYGTDIEALRADAEAEIAEIQAAIAAGADPTELLEAPAAGAGPADAEDSVQSAVVVERVGREGDVQPGYETGTTPPADFDPIFSPGVDLDVSAATAVADPVGGALPPVEDGGDTGVTPNQAPQAGDVDLGQTPEETTVVISRADLLANTTDPDTAPEDLSVTRVTLVNPNAGSLEENGDGTWTYTPANDFNDQDVEIEFAVSDGVAEDLATALIDVTPVNDVPVASGSSNSTDEDTVILAASVPAASDADGTIASYALGDDVAEGNLTFNADGSYSFDPAGAFDDLAPGESRDVSFTYTATDNDGGVSDPATVTITVTGTNDAPQASDDFIESTVLYGQRGAQRPGWDGVTLTADSGLDGVSASITGVNAAAGLGVRSSGSGNNRIDQIEHRADGSSESLTVQFDGPVLAATFGYNRLFNQGAQESGDTAEQGQWVAVLNGVDIASGSFVADAGQISGTATVDTGGRPFDAIRFESLPYADGSAPLDSSDYLVQWVEATEPAGLASTTADSVLQIGSTDLLSNDSDPNGDPLTIVSVDTQTQNGAAVSLIDGNVVYNPNGAFSGLASGETATDQFTYTISDGHGGTDSATVHVTVIGVENSADPDDILVGGSGDDILVGGIGADTLSGGAGSDQFVWNAGDQGAFGSPAIDTLTDFSRPEGDALNIADLLDGATSDNLTQYLHFEQQVDDQGTNTLLHISSTGGFADGSYAVGAVDQTIVLQGIDLTAIGSDQQIIDSLIQNQHLITS